MRAFVYNDVMAARIPFQREAIAEVCRRHRVRRLSLFGSVLRDDFDPGRSDIDALVEFEPGADPSLFTLVRLGDDLSGVFGGPVHVVTPGSLNKYFRDQVLTEAEPQNVAA